MTPWLGFLSLSLECIKGKVHQDFCDILLLLAHSESKNEYVSLELLQLI